MIHGSAAGRTDGDGAARAAEACEHLFRELSRWVGRDGCHALFTRSLAEARTDHPALATIQLRARSDPYIDGVGDTIASYGDTETTGALESMVARLFELLARLIGEDMAEKLIARSAEASESGNAFRNQQEDA